jgi:hypothetical protein
MSEGLHTPPVVETTSYWGIHLVASGCPSCGAAFLIQPGNETGLCPACASRSLVAQPVRMRSEPPELLAPYEVDDGHAASLIANWTAGVWLRPPDFSANALRSRLRRVYLPMWLVDGTVAGLWQAQAGFDYQVESATEIYSGGKWMTQKKVETRVRWEARIGEIQISYQNVAAPALEEHGQIIDGLGGYDTTKAQAYQQEALRDAFVRIPDLEPDHAWSLAKPQFDRRAAQDAQTAAGAQHLDRFRLEADYRDLNWTQLLLPAYATWYKDENGRALPVWINGQNGRILGVRRASQKAGWRITGILAGIAFIAFLIAVLMNVAASVINTGAIAALFYAASAALALGSPIPAVWAWQFNRSNPLPKPIHLQK